MIDKTIGVTKAYTTRVGEGPFPSEIFGEEAIDLRERGGGIRHDNTKAKESGLV